MLIMFLFNYVFLFVRAVERPLALQQRQKKDVVFHNDIFFQTKQLIQHNVKSSFPMIHY